MFRNYLVVAWRNLLRNRIYSAVNLLGLALALGCGLLIFQFVRHELSFDAFHEKADRVHLVYEHDLRAAGTPLEYHTMLSADKQQALAENYPEIIRTARVKWFQAQVSQGERSLAQQGAAVDPAFLDMFSLPMLQGDPSSALESPGAVVLTQKAARQLLGETDPVGQVVSVQFKGEPQECTVTGVLRDIPENSSLRFEVLVPYKALEPATGKGMVQAYNKQCTFAELSNPTSATQLEARFPALAREDEKDQVSLHLLPVDQMHFAPHWIFGPQLQNNGKPVYVYILSGIGLLVLSVACISFANLALGRASLRAREIGVRKVAGARRRDLVGQFWGEAVLLSLFALLLGLALAEFPLPYFNDLVQRSLALDLTRPGTLLSALGLALLVGTAAGAYPALVLSGLQPVAALSRGSGLGGRSTFSRGLIVLQFALSILLVVCTLNMGQQLDYLRTKDLGFSGDQVIEVDLPLPNSAQVLEVFKNELAAHPQQVLGCAGAMPAPGAGGARCFWRVGARESSGGLFNVGYEFVETLGLDLLAGRDFSRDFATDATEAVIVNQTLAKSLGMDDPLGQELVETEMGGRQKRMRIIGVVKDFHYASLHQEIEPAMLQVGGFWFIQTLVRLDAGNIPAALETVKRAWAKAAPDQEFRYQFLDELFDGMYHQEERWGWIVRVAAGFALLIACLGLFGLVALVTGRRTKEIGIRKVLGASIPSIVALLSKEFTCLVLAANLIAWPVAWYSMNRWLQSFAYRIDLGPGVFVLGGVLALVIAWLTVSYQAIRAARANPVEALRYE